MTSPQQKAFNLFHQTAKNVPAYRKFLKKNHLKPASIKTFRDFQQVPPTNKKNYINHYSLQERLYQGKQISDYYMITSSSGTSGQPTFWPRDFSTDQKLEAAKAALFEEHFQVSKRKTLCLITFGLGVWTAGMLSSKLSWPVGQKHRFSVITPGIDKDSTLSLIKHLYPYYDQIILLGYPPFLTDLIEAAAQARFNLKQANLKLFYTSEHVSPQWKQSMLKLISSNQDPESIVGFYACSDTGIIGAETKSSIKLLELAAKKPTLNFALFNSQTVPSLTSYDPNIKYLESVDNEIAITADQPVPLIRYNIHDRGSILTKAQIKKILLRTNTRFPSHQLSDHFVYIFGRSDAVKITANIYIEDIRYCLEKSPFRKKLTLNFMYGTIPSSNLRYRLKIIIYLKPGQKLTDQEISRFETQFHQHLLEANNDFKMIQSGTNIEPFLFEYTTDPDNKYQTSKLKHFL